MDRWEHHYKIVESFNKRDKAWMGLCIALAPYLAAIVGAILTALMGTKVVSWLL
jgi:kynureninase